MGIRRLGSKAEYGVYLWRLPNGNILGDSDKNLLNVQTYRGDLEAIRNLQLAAAAEGYPEGSAHFEAGVGRITESEHREDQQRLEDGLIPYGDTEAWLEEWKNDRERE